MRSRYSRIRLAVIVAAICAGLLLYVLRIRAAQLTPDEFEGIARLELKSLDEWQTQFEKVTTAKLFTQNLTGVVMQNKDPFKKGEGGQFFSGYHAADAAWVWDFACTTVEDYLPYPHYIYHYYALILSSDFKVIGVRGVRGGS